MAEAKKKNYQITLTKKFEVEAENEDDAWGRAAEVFSDEWSQACSIDDVLNVEVEEIKKEKRG